MKQYEIPRSVWTNPWHFMAFGFGSGAIPWAPGTWGTLMAVPFYCVLRELPLWLMVVVVIVAIVLGTVICHTTARDMGVHDCPGIVWDEMVGYWLTLLAAPPQTVYLIVGFVLFRLFDIVKPWPIAWVDKRVTGGVGIMLDDILAAFFAWCCLHGLVRCVALIQ